MSKKESTQTQVDEQLTRYSVFHAPYIDTVRLELKHDFWITRPYSINFTYTNKGNYSRPIIPPRKQVNPKEWGEYLRPEDFRDQDFECLAKYYNTRNCNIWVMDRRWRNSETREIFLKPYPMIKTLLFPLPTEYDRPTREHLVFLMRLYSSVHNILIRKTEYKLGENKKVEKGNKKEENNAKRKAGENNTHRQMSYLSDHFSDYA